MQSFLEEDYFPLSPSHLLRYYPWILICPLVVPSFETFISCYNYSPIQQSRQFWTRTFACYVRGEGANKKTRQYPLSKSPIIQLKGLGFHQAKCIEVQLKTHY